MAPRTGAVTNRTTRHGRIIETSPMGWGEGRLPGRDAPSEPLSRFVRPDPVRREPIPQAVAPTADIDWAKARLDRCRQRSTRNVASPDVSQPVTARNSMVCQNDDPGTAKLPPA